MISTYNVLFDPADTTDTTYEWKFLLMVVITLWLNLTSLLFAKLLLIYLQEHLIDQDEVPLIPELKNMLISETQARSFGININSKFHWFGGRGSILFEDHDVSILLRFEKALMTCSTQMSSSKEYPHPLCIEIDRAISIDISHVCISSWQTEFRTEVGHTMSGGRNWCMYWYCASVSITRPTFDPYKGPVSYSSSKSM